MDRDHIYKIVRGTGYVTHGQANEIANLLAPAAAQDEALVRAAQAVVERWDTPLWKDAKPTAEFIWRLRAALASRQQESRDAE